MTELEQQVTAARRQIVSDGYEMSIGELMSLYKGGELIINPVYQRLFRWEDSQKTRFIESILLGIPIPPIFVFQKANGVWELIDGLQRVSTVFEFAGVLRGPDGNPMPASEMQGTNLLPALDQVHWEPVEQDDPLSLTVSQQLDIKRARLRVEILKKESDEEAKFELFQRLNTGGSKLSEQEVRNCVLVMIDEAFFAWLKDLTALEEFERTVPLSEQALREAKHLELALRFIAYRRIPYAGRLDVNEYLDKAALQLAHIGVDDRDAEAAIFRSTFGLLDGALGADSFKRWDGGRHVGAFTISGFDAIAHGVASNLAAIEGLGNRNDWLQERARSIWAQERFRANSGMGVRGTTRLMNLLPFGVEYFRP